MSITSPITIAALVALVAVLWGGIAFKLRQSPLIGYIIAGIVLGPSGLKLVENRETVTLLAEFGVLTLLFVVGMELDLRRFVKAWRIVVITALAQIAGSVGLLLILYNFLGWSLGLAILLGFVVSVSSTAVVIKMLESSGELSTPAGRISVGVLIAQDIAVVPMMLVLSSLTDEGFTVSDLGRIVFSVAFLAFLIWILVRRKVHLPLGRLVIGNVDLAPLVALAYCFTGAALSGLADLSPAYGAFLAGMLIGNSDYSNQILHAVHPIQSVLMMVFFLSTGLLLEPGFIWQNLQIIMLLLFIVLIFKTALNIGVIRFLSGSWSVAILAGVALAQIGEFSFLLAEAGTRYRLISHADAQVVATVTVFSLVLSPFAMIGARRLQKCVESGHTSWRDILGIFWISSTDVKNIVDTASRLTDTSPTPPPPAPEQDAGPVNVSSKKTKSASGKKKLPPAPDDNDQDQDDARLPA